MVAEIQREATNPRCNVRDDVLGMARVESFKTRIEAEVLADMPCGASGLAKVRALCGSWGNAASAIMRRL